MEKRIITISREFGSGGRSIGRAVADKLGIPFYDKELVEQVALESGFESVDGYQRAFYKEFGCNPYEYSIRPTPIYLFKPYGIKYANRKENKDMSEVKSVFVQVIEKPERKVIIKRGKEATEYFKYCEEVGCDVWGLLCSMKSITGEPVCLWLPKNYIKTGTSEYVQGVEVSTDYSGEIPEGFDVIELPKFLSVIIKFFIKLFSKK